MEKRETAAEKAARKKREQDAGKRRHNDARTKEAKASEPQKGPIEPIPSGLLTPVPEVIEDRPKDEQPEFRSDLTRDELKHTRPMEALKHGDAHGRLPGAGSLNLSDEPLPAGTSGPLVGVGDGPSALAAAETSAVPFANIDEPVGAPDPPLTGQLAKDKAAEVRAKSEAAAARGEADPEPTVPSGPAPEVDFEAAEVLDGSEVPLLNPLPVPQTFQFGGLFHTVRAKGVDLVPKDAAAHVVGPENEGGTLSHTGLRRLYGPQERFKAQADAQGVSVAEWAQRRNDCLVAEAFSIGSGYAAQHGLQDDTE